MRVITDVDFSANQIVVRTGKGQKDRVTMLPAAVKPDLISSAAPAGSSCPGRSPASTRTLAGNGAGSGYSQRLVSTSILSRASGVGTTCTNPFSSAT